MSHKKEKTVGVIGGLGPEATLDFYAKLIQKTQASSDQEHFQVIINSNPKVPDRQQALLGDGPSCAPSLIDSAKALERAGADFLVMVCNTAHAYENHIKSAVSLPFISIIKGSVQNCFIKMPIMERVGLLATDACLAANLYQNEFRKAGIECITPSADNQQRLMDLIFRIKANDRNFGMSLAMEEIAQSMIDQGADVILAACTEVPLVLKPDALPVPLVSSTDSLVEAVINFATSTDEDDVQHLFSTRHSQHGEIPYLTTSSYINA
ncbi:MAG: amino acid racemase [Chloroflexota bacterium]